MSDKDKYSIESAVADLLVSSEHNKYEFSGGQKKIYNQLCVIRDILDCFAGDNFDVSIRLDGHMARALEMIKANVTGLKAELEERKTIEEALRKNEERYRSLARVDPLTEIYNRRHFEELALTELERMLRGKGKCCIAMIDIDHFKIINDTHGHLIGDMFLVELAKTVHEQIRNIDLFARYGGEEFILLLPQTNLKNGISVLERVRKAVEAAHLDITGNKVGITVSIGVSEISSSGLTSSNIKNKLVKAIDEADKALYAAKKSGRNNVKAFKA